MTDKRLQAIRERLQSAGAEVTYDWLKADAWALLLEVERVRWL